VEVLIKARVEPGELERRVMALLDDADALPVESA